MFILFKNLTLIKKKIIKQAINKSKDVIGFIKLKLKYPIEKKITFVIIISKFVKKSDLYFSYKI